MAHRIDTCTELRANAWLKMIRQSLYGMRDWSSRSPTRPALKIDIAHVEMRNRGYEYLHSSEDCTEQATPSYAIRKRHTHAVLCNTGCTYQHPNMPSYPLHSTCYVPQSSHSPFFRDRSRLVLFFPFGAGSKKPSGISFQLCVPFGGAVTVCAFCDFRWSTACSSLDTS